MTMKMRMDADAKVWMNVADVQKYYAEHEPFLMKMRTATLGTVHIVANYSGWCTCRTENGNLLQMWAGDVHRI